MKEIPRKPIRVPFDHPELKQKRAPYQSPGNPYHGNGCRTKPSEADRRNPEFSGGGRRAREKRDRKDQFLASSNESADALARERQLRREYAEWFAQMNPEERASAHALGVHGHLTSGLRAGAPRESDEDLEFRAPNTLHGASIIDDPVDAIEPQRRTVEIEYLTDAEIAATADTFSDSLTWALANPLSSAKPGTPTADAPAQEEPTALVIMGRRLCAMVWALRPDLAEGLRQDSELDRAFCRAVPDAQARAACGSVFGRPLEWASRGASISQLGERLYLLAYVLRPALIEGRTLARLGAMNNKTRQAKDKLVGCLRDTFSGLMAHTMRGEMTRTRCRRSNKHAQPPGIESPRIEKAA